MNDCHSDVLPVNTLTEVMEPDMSHRKAQFNDETKVILSMIQRYEKNKLNVCQEAILLSRSTAKLILLLVHTGNKLNSLRIFAV